MEFSKQMQAANEALAAGDHRAAYEAYARAHDAGHAVNSDHMAAHRGMIRAAMAGGRFDRAVKNLFLMSAAMVFDRGQ